MVSQIFGSFIGKHIKVQGLIVLLPHLKHVNFHDHGFDNIKISLRILATLPVTSCECERSFSALKRLKTYSWSTLVEDCLVGLALMHIHQEIEPSVDEVINKFLRKSQVGTKVVKASPSHYIFFMREAQVSYRCGYCFK